MLTKHIWLRLVRLRRNVCRRRAAFLKLSQLLFMYMSSSNLEDFFDGVLERDISLIHICCRIFILFYSYRNNSYSNQYTATVVFPVLLHVVCLCWANKSSFQKVVDTNTIHNVILKTFKPFILYGN